MRTGLTFCRPHSEQAGQSKTSKNLQPIGTKKPRTCKLAALLFPRMHSPTRAAVTLPHTRMRLHACAHAHYATAHVLCYRRLPDMLILVHKLACTHACICAQPLCWHTCCCCCCCATQAEPLQQVQSACTPPLLVHNNKNWLALHR